MRSEKEMLDLNIIYYCHSKCIPLRSITELPENEAFQAAYQLGQNDGTSFYRFKDFINYYPKRIITEKWLYDWFLNIGGEPKTEHPLYFVLEGSNYLNEWFDKGKIIKISLSEINEKHISFTYGDSNVVFHKENRKDSPFLKKELYQTISEYGGDINKYMEYIIKEYRYIECQLWDNKYLEEIIQ
jgi:hypothetical protein